MHHHYYELLIFVLLRRTLLGVIGVLMVMATIHESCRMYFDRPMDAKTDGYLVRALHCFSALNNGRKLLATGASSENFGCINGIRVLSTTWVIMGHSWLFIFFTYKYNTSALFEVSWGSITSQVTLCTMDSQSTRVL